MSRRSYSGNAASTILNGSITSGSNSLTLLDGTNLPTGANGPFVLTLDAGSASEEKVTVASRTGNVCSGLVRGFDGTAATSHASGAAVRHTLSAVDLDEANAHLNSSATHTGLTVLPTSAAAVPLVVKGVTGQSGDLEQWQNDLAVVLARVFSNGAASFTNLALTTATTGSTASAGGTGALPATVLGYLTLSINGTLVKFPYFAI